MTVKRPQQRERAEQAAIVQLLRSIGAKVYVLGTTRRRGDFHGTMQSPGICDLVVFLPARRVKTAHAHRLVTIEVKAAGGRLRPEQHEFQTLCQSASVVHLVGGLDTVIAWLVHEGYLKASQLPFYRVPPKEERREVPTEDYR